MLAAVVSGTVINAPPTPHSQPQKTTESSTTTSESLRAFPFKGFESLKKGAG